MLRKSVFLSWTVRDGEEGEQWRETSPRLCVRQRERERDKQPEKTVRTQQKYNYVHNVYTSVVVCI